MKWGLPQGFPTDVVADASGPGQREWSDVRFPGPFPYFPISVQRIYQSSNSEKSSDCYQKMKRPFLKVWGTLGKGKEEVREWHLEVTGCQFGAPGLRVDEEQHPALGTP